LTTATDLAVQNAIRTALQSAVGAAVVGEEAGAAGGNGASFWLGRWARPPALPYVASGRVAAYVLFWTSAIHAAAGGLLAAEAGASVSDVDGRPCTIHSDSIVASATPELHHDLLALVGSEPTIRQDPNLVHTGW